jgi:hypothetical protein
MRPQVGGGACPGKRGEWLCLNGMQPCHSQGVQCLPLMQGVMKMVLPVLLLALAAPVPAFAQAPDQRRSDQERAYDARRKGEMLSPRAIEARVIPTMKGYEYLGFDLDFGSSVYTLKFMRDGVVVWVDVDGRSGQIIGRTGR